MQFQNNPGDTMFQSDRGGGSISTDRAATQGSSRDSDNLPFEDTRKGKGDGLIPDIQRISDYKKSEEKILYENYPQYTLKGILEKSKLSEYFLSPQNTDLIQKKIRFDIYNKTKKVISQQSNEELFTIMRSIYLQDGGVRISSEDEFRKVVDNLNKKVVDYSVNHIKTKLDQYDMYINDISKLPVPIDRPTYIENKNTTYDISNLL